MKHLLILIALLPTFLAGQMLSDKAEISVITCGPGKEQVYVAFGHSAFRVEDPVNRIDRVYNYGVFDFRRKNFYLNFARGHNFYRLASYDYQHFEYSYIYDNRFIHQQLLNLESRQKQKLFDYLEWNALPENQVYLYDYFYDNCATRIRDVVVNVFGDSVQFDGSYIKTDYTIRELTDLYLGPQPWGDLGIDICLGLPMDKKASPYEYMFLPDYIESGFDHATILKGNHRVPIVKQTIKVFEPGPEETPFNFFHPLPVFSVLFLLSAWLTWSDLKRKRGTQIFDVIFFGALGLTGMLLLLLWTVTDHKAAANNMNILWAVPTHIIAVIAFIRQPVWLKTYFFCSAVLSVTLLLVWFFLPQQLHYALIPVVMVSALRSFAQYHLRKIHAIENKKATAVRSAVAR